jgi:hypothetical protein
VERVKGPDAGDREMTGTPLAEGYAWLKFRYRVDELRRGYLLVRVRETGLEESPRLFEITSR